MQTVEFFQQFELFSLLREAELLVTNVLDELLGITLVVEDMSPLIDSRQEG